MNNNNALMRLLVFFLFFFALFSIIVLRGFHGRPLCDFLHSPLGAIVAAVVDSVAWNVHRSCAQLSVIMSDGKQGSGSARRGEPQDS